MWGPISAQPIAANRWRVTRATARITIRATAAGYNERSANANLRIRGFASGLQLAVYAATRELISYNNQSPPNQPFSGTMRRALRIDRSIVGRNGFGDLSASWGELELINADREYDEITKRLGFDGQRVVVRAGRKGQGYNFLKIFDGLAERVELSEEALRIRIRDKGYFLEVPAQPNLYAGTGDINGGEDLKGKRKPRAFGPCMNITPVLLIPAEGVYETNDGPVQAIPAVYDRGVALEYAGDFPTTAALRAATTGASGSGADIEAGQFATCLDENGRFRVGGGVQGAITCDVEGDTTDGYIETSADIVKRLILSATRLRSAELSLPSFAEVNAAQPAPIAYYLDQNSNETVDECIRKIMHGIGGWGAFRRNGTFEVNIFSAPAGVPSERYSRIDFTESGGIDRIPLPEEIATPPWRFRVAWGRNWTVQTDVPEGAGQDRIAFLGEPFRLAEASDADVKKDYPRASDPAPVEAYFASADDAEAEAERRLELYSASRSLYRWAVKGRVFYHELGQVAEVTYDRWDLDEGRLLRIVTLRHDEEQNQVQIEAYG